MQQRSLDNANKASSLKFLAQVTLGLLFVDSMRNERQKPSDIRNSDPAGDNRRRGFRGGEVRQAISGEICHPGSSHDAQMATPRRGSRMRKDSDPAGDYRRRGFRGGEVRGDQRRDMSPRVQPRRVED